MPRSRIAIIPARGGSKGVPRKNIVDLNGNPLISYSIEPALQLKTNGTLDEVIVSTDSEEIAGIAIGLGATVPFIRPSHLADDTAKTVDVIIHTLDFYSQKNTEFDDVVLLQPTTPLRTANDIQSAIGIYDSQEAHSLISSFREEYICDLVSYSKDGNFGVPLNRDHNAGKRRQDLEVLYVRNGAIYITSCKYLRRNNRIISDKPLMYVMAKNRSVNIDTKQDLELAQWLLSRSGS